MARIGLAFRSFFSLLSRGELSASLLADLGLNKRKAAVKPAAPARPTVATDGAVQVLAILQRDSRLIDFLMEDVSAYSDEQVGAAVRELHGHCQQSLKRYVTLKPVIDGVEGTYTSLDAAPKDASAIKLLGNVPASGSVAGGTLRHKGWRAEKVDLPPIPAGQNVTIVAPAEIEVE